MAAALVEDDGRAGDLLIVCGTGAIANIGVGKLMFGQHAQRWVEGIAGATVSAVWNYAASSLLTWKAHGHDISAALRLMRGRGPGAEVFEGIGGQPPVFYNLLVTAAAAMAMTLFIDRDTIARSRSCSGARRSWH